MHCVFVVKYASVTLLKIGRIKKDSNTERVFLYSFSIVSLLKE